MCARRLEALPLHIGSWKCPSCATVHDRDHNAAKNILAAGRAERRNASHNGGRDRASGSGPGGAPVSPSTTRRRRAMKQEAPKRGVAARAHVNTTPCS
jgi:putative transposase